jgi:hypothetical protein
VKKRYYGLCTFIYLYKNRTMKLVEVFLSRREEDEGE